MWIACCMAILVSYAQASSQYPPNITMTLKYTCHSLISHWIEGASPLWCVYILGSPKLLSFSRMPTYIWAELTRWFDQSRQLYPILQCGEASQGLYSSFIMAGWLPGTYLVLNLTKSWQSLIYQLATTICTALGLVLQHPQNRLAYQMYTSRLWADGKVMPTSTTSELPLNNWPTYQSYCYLIYWNITLDKNPMNSG